METKKEKEREERQRQTLEDHLTVLGIVLGGLAKQEAQHARGQLQEEGLFPPVHIFGSLTPVPQGAVTDGQRRVEGVLVELDQQATLMLLCARGWGREKEEERGCEKE